MTYKIPFTEKSVAKDITGKEMRLGYRKVGHHSVNKLTDFTLDKHEVIDGVLYLLDERDSITHAVTAIEVENNALFFSGEVMGAHGRDGAVRMMLYEKKELGSDFLIAVSSHVDYEAKALPRLIRSLAREGISEDKVVVFVAGSDSSEITQEKGYTRFPVKDNYMGCTALSGLLDMDIELSYALLLHDTCEVTSGFAEKVSKIDVGIPYDMISAQREIGFWSKAFLNRIKSLQGFRIPLSGYEVYNSLMDLCRLSCNCSEVQGLRSKDVYGTGVRRQVQELVDIGVKKYSGSNMTGGRP
jgi:hypothetical protein